MFRFFLLPFAGKPVEPSPDQLNDPQHKQPNQQHRAAKQQYILPVCRKSHLIVLRKDRPGFPDRDPFRLDQQPLVLPLGNQCQFLVSFFRRQVQFLQSGGRQHLNAPDPVNHRPVQYIQDHQVSGNQLVQVLQHPVIRQSGVSEESFRFQHARAGQHDVLPASVRRQGTRIHMHQFPCRRRLGAQMIYRQGYPDIRDDQFRNHA